MKPSRLGLVGRFALALLAVFAFGAVVASAAWAEEAPRWKIEGTTLGENQTAEIVSKIPETHGAITEPISLEGDGLKIICESTKFKAGAFLAGSAVGEPGKAYLTSEFSKCTITGNNKEGTCKVKEPIVTKAVRAELVMNTELTHYLLEFDPVAGTVFANIEMANASECKFANIEVKGLVIGSSYTDPAITGLPPELVGPSTPASASLLVVFPDVVEKVWLWKGGVHEEFKPTELNILGTNKATLKGEVLVALASGKKYSISG
jgi:hypothetical protein